MTGLFSALVIQDTAAMPDRVQLARVLDQHFVAGTEAPADLAEDGVFALEMEGVLLAVERVDTPLPHDPLGAGVQPARPWPAGPVLDGHGAHLRVAALETPDDAGEAKRAARLCTIVAGIVTRITKARGLFVPSSGAVLPEVEALRAAHSAAAGVSPIEAWVTFYPLGPDADGEGRPHGALSHGIAPLLGREIEVAPVPITRRKALDRVYGLAWRVLDGAGPPAEGEELRDSEDHRIGTVRVVPGWLREGQPAWVIVGPEAVVEPRRLSLKKGQDPAVLTTPSHSETAAEPTV